MKKDFSGIAEDINQRIGSLLRKERRLAGKTLADVANTFKIDSILLVRWEEGLASPPASLFYSIIRYYGHGALERAEFLDLELQLERNLRKVSIKAKSDCHLRLIHSVC